MKKITITDFKLTNKYLNYSINLLFKQITSRLFHLEIKQVLSFLKKTYTISIYFPPLSPLGGKVGIGGKLYASNTTHKNDSSHDR